MPRIPSKKRTQEGHVVAPIAGLDTVSPASQMDPAAAVALVNMIMAEYGLRTRVGYQLWTDAGFAGNPIRSVLPYVGTAIGSANDRLFIATMLGIYDCTTSGAAPGSQPITFGVQDANSGFGEAFAFTNTAGNKFMIYCDESNGYFVYTDGTGWAQVAQGVGGTQINGVNPNLFAFGVVFKNRVWFVEKASTRAWYTDLNSLYGTVTKFDFGPQFPKGGQLAALYVWTMDGGSGADDLLVAMSTNGDVVVYQGTDPAQAQTFGKIGGWNMGAVPNGRRLATTFGGELLMLSGVGMIPISRLVAGRSLLQPDTAQTARIRNVLNATMNDRRTLTGWSVLTDPVDNTVLITVPALTGELPQQFAMGLASNGWAQYSNKPIYSGAVWHGKLYFGTSDGKLCVSTGYSDNVSRDSLAATPIDFSGQTAFSFLNTPMNKRLHLIIANILTQGTAPSLAVEARYDLNVDPVLTTPQPASLLVGGVWDESNWDEATFAAPLVPFNPVFGATGAGRKVSIAFAGKSQGRFSLIGFDVAYEPGGFL